MEIVKATASAADPMSELALWVHRCRVAGLHERWARVQAGCRDAGVHEVEGFSCVVLV